MKLRKKQKFFAKQAFFVSTLFLMCCLQSPSKTLKSVCQLDLLILKQIFQTVHVF